MEESEVPPQCVFSPIYIPVPFLEECPRNRETQNEPKQFNCTSSPLTISGESSSCFTALLNSKLNCLELRMFYQLLSKKSPSQQTQEDATFLLQLKNSIANYGRGDFHFFPLQVDCNRQQFSKRKQEENLHTPNKPLRWLESQNSMGPLAHGVQVVNNLRRKKTQAMGCFGSPLGTAVGS